MIYGLLRWISGIAIHWFYRDIRVTNRIAIPDHGPLLVAVNHQNALVDSLITGWVVRRRVTMTAKATLTANPLIALFFRILGVVPLRRASDETTSQNTSTVDRSRNSGAFREILGVLERNGAVLIFPEGKSHNEPRLEPLRTGLARLALKARDEQGIRDVKILPVGLVFENKAAPGSDVAVNVGDVIDVDSWRGADHTALTAEISRRLKSVVEGIPITLAIDGEAESPVERRNSLLIRAMASWGRFTHRLPISAARRVAIQSTDADQPAMRTIMLGIVLVLLTYAASFAVIEAITHSVWLGAIGVTSLAVGAYWAAFEGHPRID